MAAQYAFVMKDMTKSFPGAQKPVLSHINLQFYHGAKIGDIVDVLVDKDGRMVALIVFQQRHSQH